MAASRQEFSREEIRELLTELGSRLQAKGVEASLYLVGGAAIALEFNVRRVTRDIDAAFHPEASVRAEAKAMAAELNLPRAWLSDSVRMFLPGGDDEAVPLSIPGLSVAVASARHLLAMKMAAFRPTDRGDLELLFQHLDISKPEQAADLALSVYGEDTVVLPDRDELLLSAEAVLRGMGRR